MKLRSFLFILISLCCNGLFAAELGQVDAEQLLHMQKKEKALVVDIRTEQEWQSTGVIPNSQRLQAYNADGSFDAAKWLAALQKLKTSPDQEVILVCRSGNRSSKLGKMLTEQGMNQVYHLTNGMQSWIKSGYPVTTDNGAATQK